MGVKLLGKIKIHEIAKKFNLTSKEVLEVAKELNIEANADELHYIKTIKKSSRYTSTFINNEFDDLYILRTNRKIQDMKFQQEEISEIFYVPYNKFKEMVKNKQSDLLMHTEEFEILFNMFDEEFGI